VCPFLPSQANGKLQSAVSEFPINETRRSTFAIRIGNESDPEAGRGHKKQSGDIKRSRDEFNRNLLFFEIRQYTGVKIVLMFRQKLRPAGDANPGGGD